jgi:bifunctional non-homologous end joining protein LigD
MSAPRSSGSYRWASSSCTPFWVARAISSTPRRCSSTSIPRPRRGLLEAAEVALLVRERLEGMGLQPYAKTSGSAGMHVLVPTERGATYAETRALAVRIAKELATARPDLVSDRMARAGRAGRVLVDARTRCGSRPSCPTHSARRGDRRCRPR